MQAALAAMAAAHTILSAAAPPFEVPLFSSFPVTAAVSHSITVAATPFKPLTVVAATKKALAVLKGNSPVEGVVTLTQQDNGSFLYKLGFQVVLILI